MTVSSVGTCNQQLPALLRANNASTSDDSPNGTSASIAANDFLTLLVTEMKNQDPTANTDPNEYVNQLVQVNSLQQLISINETLKNALTTDTSNGAKPETVRVEAPSKSASFASHRVQQIAGNLSEPTSDDRSSRLANALSNR